ncbi:MAG: hypothetical protein UZ05_CHB002002122 [Chlorobi bacterium OLB5]|nr:MAG: hypothetical protein UZ05_CHB002002122 [Chlorobi bacterium OLB5]
MIPLLNRTSSPSPSPPEYMRGADTGKNIRGTKEAGITFLREEGMLIKN